MNETREEGSAAEEYGNLELTLYPNKILTTGNKKVTQEMLPEVINNIEIMEKMLQHHNGVGLAAPQVGLNMQFFIIRHEDCNINVINPNIVSYGKDKEKGVEGCISLPDVLVSVKRSKSVVINYLDEKWEVQHRTFKGFEARIVQHEIDHLSGILLTHRMNEIDKIKNRFALRNLRYMAENEDTDNPDAQTA